MQHYCSGVVVGVPDCSIWEAGAECACGLVALVIRIAKCIREGSTMPPY